MPSEKPSEQEIIEALQAIDSKTLQAIAAELGFGESTLWRYRRGESIPPARRRPLARGLSLDPGLLARLERELYPSVAELESERQRPTFRRNDS